MYSNTYIYIYLQQLLVIVYNEHNFLWKEIKK
jgi:hypothetical protein